jgi:hypothetical protein
MEYSGLRNYYRAWEYRIYKNCKFQKRNSNILPFSYCTAQNSEKISGINGKQPRNVQEVLIYVHSHIKKWNNWSQVQLMVNINQKYFFN